MNRYHIALLTSVLIWSLSFVWTKGALEFLTPTLLIFFRMIIAFTLLLMVGTFSHRLKRLPRRDVIILALISLFEPFGYFLFETIGMSYVKPTLAVIIISTIPLFTPILSYFVNKENVSKRGWIALLISVAGVFLVVLSDGFSDIGGRLTGVFFLFGAVITAMIYTVSIQRLSQRVNSVSIVCYQNIFSIIYMMPIILLRDYSALSNLEFNWAWAYRILALGVLCSGLAFVLYADGLRKLGVTRTSMYINLMPGATAIASYFIVGEQLGAIKILGILVTISGLMIGTIKLSKNNLK